MAILKRGNFLRDEIFLDQDMKSVAFALLYFSSLTTNTPYCSYNYAIYDPVCGTDGLTYSNSGHLICEALLTQGLQKAYDGECREATSTAAPSAESVALANADKAYRDMDLQDYGIETVDGIATESLIPATTTKTRFLLPKLDDVLFSTSEPEVDFETRLPLTDYSTNDNTESETSVPLTTTSRYNPWADGSRVPPVPSSDSPKSDGTDFNSEDNDTVEYVDYSFNSLDDLNVTHGNLTTHWYDPQTGRFIIRRFYHPSYGHVNRPSRWFHFGRFGYGGLPYGYGFPGKTGNVRFGKKSIKNATLARMAHEAAKGDDALVSEIKYMAAIISGKLKHSDQNDQGEDSHLGNNRWTPYRDDLQYAGPYAVNTQMTPSLIRVPLADDSTRAPPDGVQNFHGLQTFDENWMPKLEDGSPGHKHRSHAGGHVNRHQGSGNSFGKRSRSSSRGREGGYKSSSNRFPYRRIYSFPINRSYH